MELTAALKEWAIAVEALERGETILLLRKGGIREVGGHFRVPESEVLLYPTFEHQKPELLKSDYREKVTPVPSGWHPERVRIGSWARITDLWPIAVETEEIAASVQSALQPYHIWNDRFVSDRLQWKPRQPLYLLLLRTYHLSQPREIDYSEAYGGCKSWIHLTEAITTTDSFPVLEDQAYNTLRNQIQHRVTAMT
jgi:hypothetical protein